MIDSRFVRAGIFALLVVLKMISLFIPVIQGSVDGVIIGVLLLCFLESFSMPSDKKS